MTAARHGFNKGPRFERLGPLEQADTGSQVLDADDVAAWRGADAAPDLQGVRRW